MIRRLGFVVVVLAFIVSACGRQVTPNRAGTGGNTNLLSGFMSVKFKVMGPLDFTNHSYVVVFNTTGNGITPLPNGFNTNFAGYAFALIVYGAGGQAAVQAVQYARPLNSSQAPVLYSLPTTPQQLQLVPNDNGSGTEFTVTFQRQIFAGINVGASTSPSASASASASPTASPSPSPTASGATPSPSTSPTATPPFATMWNFNYFVTTPYSPTGISLPTAQDSLGTNGANDTSYVSPSLDTTQIFDITFNVILGTHPTDDNGSDDIVSGEISNNP